MLGGGRDGVGNAEPAGGAGRRRGRKPVGALRRRRALQAKGGPAGDGAADLGGAGHGSEAEETLNHACWGQLRGDNSKCTPAFSGGTAHFKNKFCPACKTGCFEIPTTHIRAATLMEHGLGLARPGNC